MDDPKSHFNTGRRHTQATKDKISKAKAKHPRVEGVCPCGTPFSFPGWVKTRKFCSAKCRNFYGASTGHIVSEETRRKLSEMFKGEKGPGWRGGRDKVSSRETAHEKARHAAWRKLVFARDDYTCQKCGARGVKLQADHVKPYRLCTENEKWAADNGQTLCLKCHGEKTAEEHRLHWVNQHGDSTMSGFKTVNYYKKKRLEHAIPEQ